MARARGGARRDGDVMASPLEVRAPATGAVLGTVAPVDLEAAAAAARTAQPLWSLVPASSRARYLRRAAVAMLDELDDLAARLAEETGRPRTQLVQAELLPAVRGLDALANDGPRALADRRVSPRAALLAGRSTRLVQSPVGVIGLAGPSGSPWAEPALEAAAALVAGNGVLLTAGAPLAAQRLRGVFLRARPPRRTDHQRPGRRPGGGLSTRRRAPAARPAGHARGARGRAEAAGRRRGGVGRVRRPRGRRRAARGRRGRRAGAAGGARAARRDAARRRSARRGHRRRPARGRTDRFAGRPRRRRRRSPLHRPAARADARRGRGAGRRHRRARRRARGRRRTDLGLGARSGEGRAGRAAAAVDDDLGRPPRARADERAGTARPPHRGAPTRVARRVGAGHAHAARRSVPRRHRQLAHRSPARTRVPPLAGAARAGPAQAVSRRAAGRRGPSRAVAGRRGPSRAVAGRGPSRAVAGRRGAGRRGPSRAVAGRRGPRAQRNAVLWTR